jgi:hypothetical protein
LKRINDGDSPLDEHEHKIYRQSVGRLQWLVPIRPDICYSVKELARGLAHPTIEDQSKLKHLLRYLKGTLDYRFVIRPQYSLKNRSSIEIDCYCDSDWAGCPRTRKSTSGFILQVLGSTVQFGSRTQSVHALSSGEAELYAIGSGMAEALHLKSFLEESGFCKQAKIILRTDSTAGKSMATRYGTSKKTRHVQLKYLYVQHLIDNRTVVLRKVPGIENYSDIFTKYVSNEIMLRHLQYVGLFPSSEHLSIGCVYTHRISDTYMSFYQQANSLCNLSSSGNELSSSSTSKGLDISTMKFESMNNS